MKIQGLYGITPEWDDTDQLIDAVKQAIEGGMRVLQLRRKQSDQRQRKYQAIALQTLCQAHNVPLIINDDWRLALDVDAAGVHIGKNDSNLAEVRTHAKHLIIGTSCYDQTHLAHQAINAGADYIAYGAVFPSPTKPFAVTAPLTLFQEPLAPNHRGTPTPKIAIGGITPENAATVIEAGADAIAVISALFGATNIKQQAQQFSQLFEQALDSNRLK